MFKALATLLVGVALLTCASASNAQTDTVSAEELLRASGLWEQFAAIAPQVSAGVLAAVSGPQSSPDRAELERLSKVIDAAFSADRLRSVGVATVKAETNSEHLPVLRRWYASQLGREITRLEEAASREQTDAQAILQQGGAALAGMPLERRAKLDELVVVTRTPERIMHLTVETAVAVLRGASSLASTAPGASEDDLRSTLELQRPQMLQSFTEFSLASYALAYESLSTSDLAQYVEFLKSPAGRHFTDIGMRALTNGFVEGSTELGRGLTEAKPEV